MQHFSKFLNFLKTPKMCFILGLRYSNSAKDEIKINMKKIPMKNIRNFGIIAHVDHGKSTLSDRFMEYAGNLSKASKNEQVLDKLQVERERGITVKAQTVSLFYEFNDEVYLLNLIDTPGHVDFSYEVNRSLCACQGVILLVDANQGVQAQTVANFNLAFTQDMTIIPVINKIDLKNANPDIVSNQMTKLFGFDEADIHKISAKLGQGVEDVIKSVIEKIPPPNGDRNKPFRGLLYDSWYSRYHGVICLLLIVDGSLSVGNEIKCFSCESSFQVKEIGILYPNEVPVSDLFAGQAGYFRANIKNPNDAKVGDTWFKSDTNVEKLPVIADSKPMVFAGIFPSDQSELQDLGKSIQKLTLNDSSVTVSLDSSAALGKGWRLGFLGLLHMEVFCQRLQQEFNTEVIVTAPGIPYKLKIKGQNNIKTYCGEEIIVSNPNEFPPPEIIEEYFEPMVLGTIITPSDYYSAVLKMCLNRRGEQKSAQNIDDHTILLTYKFPMNEIIVDFFDELKQISSGFASFDYEEIGYESSVLKKIDIYLNGKIVDELSHIIHASKVEQVGRSLCMRLKECIEPQLYVIAIQACIGAKVIARENIKALKKNVTAKLYGGDVTRRMKLLQRQKEGKKGLRMVGNVPIPRNVFINILKK
ncbi:translation factor GUF1 homolog, mitochondrial isoform X2 [Parasteatoda tepidariorum]|uniref:translation factor GUF1 homolog, mitochondrial isoform X2 n=1 Tax=Parasteatoda tepidariorum TaxID=114398 RepID=UPI00077FD933|nr:translation factor GUF1 homolog, mitochondrial isoform X2 [Parasteatoda tepidariorum]XP_042895765.1 translation factor GUF1 homolog, mitochondrial isoform X2 [Parasteatoda tepidariorum]XP_042895766.1 translation factor GUF1 homolog, mitochondrial isoform X2 [Parasteatoda tepidariorum]